MFATETNLQKRPNMTHALRTIGHHTAFNNEPGLNRIVSYNPIHIKENIPLIGSQYMGSEGIWYRIYWAGTFV